MKKNEIKLERIKKNKPFGVGSVKGPAEPVLILEGVALCFIIEKKKIKQK
jgi:hypothetical protein